MSRRVLTARERTMIEAMTMYPGEATALRRAQRCCGGTRARVCGRERAGGGHSADGLLLAGPLSRAAALALAARLQDGERSGRPRTVTGRIELLLEAVLDQDPRDRVSVDRVDGSFAAAVLGGRPRLSVSRQSVSLALVRLHIRWKRPRHQLALRAPTWRQAKGA